VRSRSLALRAFVVVALAVAGCATPPAPTPDAPAAPIFVAPPDTGPLINRDEDFAIVAVRDGDTLAQLAERYLGDAKKAWWIAQFNGVTAVRAGQTIVIPLRIRNAVGVYANGYQTIPVLCYHRFGSRDSKLNVTPAAFEAQMTYLARNGYTVIPLKRLARFLAGKEPLPAKTVAITIDDGYRSTYEIAYPILRKFGFPATVFLYTDFVGASDAMTWAQMKEMEASGLIDVQPHSKSHANLTLRLPGEPDAKYKERIKREVDVPVAVLRERLGDGSFTFAYPYGDVNEWVVDLLARQNVSQGVTVTPGGNGFFAYPYMLRRTMVFGNDDLDAFKGKLVTFVRTASR
jgi:peptidoglycan/xylan/chitin deacetylase (PgdA/CDA1 family)